MIDDIDNTGYLNQSALHLWSFKCTPECFMHSRELLSKKEIDRSEQYLLSKSRQQYTIRRGILRLLLSVYLNRPAEQIQISYNKFGKPYLETLDLHFNLSYTNNSVLVGLTRMAPLGVDIESISRASNSISVADQFFSSNESIWLNQIKESQRAKMFTFCWTRKEAVIKQIGDGLSFPLDGFDVVESFTPEVWTEIRINHHLKLNVLSWQPESGLCASVAMKDHPKEVSFFSHNHLLSLLSKTKLTTE